MLRLPCACAMFPAFIDSLIRVAGDSFNCLADEGYIYLCPMGDVPEIILT